MWQAAFAGSIAEPIKHCDAGPPCISGRAFCTGICGSTIEIKATTLASIFHGCNFLCLDEPVLPNIAASGRPKTTSSRVKISLGAF